MHVTNSFLYTVLERMRSYIDLSTVDGKYSDDYCCRHLIIPATVDTISRAMGSSDVPIICQMTLNMVTFQQYYELPPNVQTIIRIGKYDPNGFLQLDSIPRSRFSPGGPCWSVEGRLLSILPFPIINDTFVVEYIPSGDVGVHYGTDAAVASDNKTLIMSNSPVLGFVDRRPNAYVGSILRILPDSGPVQERVITAHSVITTAGTVTVREAFSPSLANTSNVKYEIAPLGDQAFYECVGLAAARKLAISARLSQTTMEMMRTEYLGARKTFRDRVSATQGRIGRFFDRNTVDNPDNERPFGV